MFSRGQARKRGIRRGRFGFSASKRLERRELAASVVHAGQGVQKDGRVQELSSREEHPVSDSVDSRRSRQRRTRVSRRDALGNHSQERENERIASRTVLDSRRRPRRYVRS